METLKKSKRAHKFLIAGAVLTTASFFLTIIPCSIKEASASALGFCKLPNPLNNLDPAYLSYYYYGLYNNPISGILLQFLATTLLAYLAVYLFKKIRGKARNYKVIDLTRKRD